MKTKLYRVEGRDVFGDNPHMTFVGIYDRAGLKALHQVFLQAGKPSSFCGCEVFNFFEDITVSECFVNEPLKGKTLSLAELARLIYEPVAVEKVAPPLQGEEVRMASLNKMDATLRESQAVYHVSDEKRRKGMVQSGAV